MADRHEQELARELKRRGFTRREIIKLGLGLGLSATGVSTLLAACGQAPGPQTSEGQGAAATAAPAAPTTAPAAAAEPTSAVLYDEAEGAGGPWPQAVVPEPGSKVEISVAHAWDATFMERQKQFDNQFMKRHPNITVKAENTPWGEFLQKYLAQAAGNALPDLLYVQFAWAQQLIKDTLLVPLDDYVKQQTDFNIEDFTKPSLVSYYKDGKLYGIPYDEGPGVLYYNKDIFDKAGVAYPTDEWTLDDLKANAIKLSSGEGPNRVFGFLQTPGPGTLNAPSFLFPFGAQYISEPNEDKCLINEPVAVETLEWWLELRFKHKAIPSPADMQTGQGDMFQFGRAAMQINGSWATPGIVQNAKFKWDVAKWPKGPKKHSTFSAGSCYAITRDSKNADAAWIYLNDYISTAGQIYMWGSTGRGSPSRNSAWDSYLKSKFSPPNAKVVQDALNTIASHDIVDQPTGPRVSQAVTPIWDLVVNEQMGVKEAVDKICTEIDPILAENAKT